MRERRSSFLVLGSSLGVLGAQFPVLSAKIAIGVIPVLGMERAERALPPPSAIVCFQRLRPFLVANSGVSVCYSYIEENKWVAGGG
jgi:hypothetical protein